VWNITGCTLPIILTGATPFVSERDVKFQYERDRPARIQDALYRMSYNREMCCVKRAFPNDVHSHRERTYFAFLRPRMHSVKYAIIQCAKGPFASDSISMNVVLSSNTAYRDQFSGRTRFSSLLEKQKEKKKEKKAISYFRVIRASHAASNPLVYIRGEYVVFENVFLLLRRRFFRLSRDGHRR